MDYIYNYRNNLPSTYKLKNHSSGVDITNSSISSPDIMNLKITKEK